MGSLDFTTEKKEPKVITFTLDGRDYDFRVPKKAFSTLALLDGVAGNLLNYEWLGKGLSEEDQKRITARLRDDDDPFDMPELNKLCIGLIEAASDRPTTPLSDFGQRQNTNGKASTGKPRKRG